VRAGLRLSASAASPPSFLASVRPSPELSATDAIELQLLAMQGGDVDGGAHLWLRFAAPPFRLPGIRPWSAKALAAAVRNDTSQYSLLRDARLQVDFPSEPVERAAGGVETIWHEVELQLRAEGFEDEPDEGYTAAKLGWDLEWSGECGWRTCAISWHDFRPTFRPGLEQEEWPRICG
jgi:hypothetical protein